MELTYHLKSEVLRTKVNLLIYKPDIVKALKSFPMVKLLNITPTELTIFVGAGDDKLNGIVRQLFRTIARTSNLGKYYNKGLFRRKEI